MSLELSIQTDRLIQELHQLADNPASCAQTLQALGDDAGFDVRVDEVGHAAVRWCPPGADPDAPAVGTGSYATGLGAAAGLEALRALQRADFKPRRALEVAVFAGEDSASPATPTATSPAYHARVALHAEHGSRLEQENAPVGIAMGVAGPARYAFEVTGEDGHAGAIAMPDRRDALCAAAEAIHAIEQLARSSPSTDLVATVNALSVAPNTPHAIPSQVCFTLDLADTDALNRDQIAQAILQECRTLAHRRGLKITCQTRHARAPLACDKLIIDAIEQACDEADLRWWKLISRTANDPWLLHQTAPVGLILIPADHADSPPAPAALAAGVEVLALTLAELASASD